MQTIIDWFKEPMDTPRWFPLFILLVIYIADFLNSLDGR